MRSQFLWSCKLWLSALLILPGISAGSAALAQPTTGSLDVTVLTLADGRPVAQASVYFQDPSRPAGGRILYHLTDEDGRVVVDGVAPGTYKVAAFKKEDLYADPMFTFNATEGAYQNVIVAAGRTARVTLRLGPPGARLIVRAVDAQTGALLEGAALLLDRPEQPYSSMSVRGEELEAILPADTPVTLVVSVAGYRPWEYVDPETGGSAMVFAPGTEKTITARLRK